MFTRELRTPVPTGPRPRRARKARQVHPSSAARVRARHLGERARFVVGSALDLPFDDGTFDAVLSVASLKHWPERARGLRECARVLRPGGRLAVLEVDRGCTDEAARAFVDTWRIPAFLRPAARLMFRVSVAGPSLDLEEARVLARGLALATHEVRRVPGTPALLLRGQRAR